MPETRIRSGNVSAIGTIGIALGDFTLIEPSDAWAVDLADRAALRIEVPRTIHAS